MKLKPLVIITTRLPPAICGIGAYSWQLREHWPNESRPIEFLVVDSAPASGLSPRGDCIAAFANRPADLARELERIGAADLLLQYAGRAYHRFGFPLWLPRVLADWKRRHHGSRVVLFVHELPGKFPITSRHFWLSELNKLVVRRLAPVVDVLVTNTEHHRELLRKIARRDDVHLLPIASNIEPVEMPAVPRKRSEFVLFGLPFGRLQTLRLFAAHLERWRVTKLHLIGPDDPALPRISIPQAVLHGVLEPGRISQLLHSAAFGLTNASEETWSKSTTFMACAAHGCAPVIASRAQSIPLRYAIAADEVETISDEELVERSEKLQRWYRENAAWTVSAAKIAALVRPEEAAA